MYFLPFSFSFFYYYYYYILGAPYPLENLFFNMFLFTAGTFHFDISPYSFFFLSLSLLSGNNDKEERKEGRKKGSKERRKEGRKSSK